MTTPCDLLITNVHVASMQDNDQPYGWFKDSAVAIIDGKFCYVGTTEDCLFHSDNTIDGNGKWLTPGLIDCHTHLVYGGNRAEEFEQRLQGVSYAEIAKRGGGIQSTVNATRQASRQDLLTSALKRAKRLVEEGVTCIEVKSGYGLDDETEVAMLEVAQQIGEALPVSIVTTYLGAHTVPKEFKQDADAYVNFVCETMIPKVAKQKLAGCVDVFCESIGFNVEQTRKVFEAAKQHGLDVKAHVEQLSDLKGAVLAAKYGALSVDHVEYLSPDDVPALKQSGTVAVMLPGAFYFLNETTKPPIEALRNHKVPMAVATDLNPGSSPLASLLTSMNMACVLFGMTPEESLAGTTIHAARALGKTNKGVVAEGKDADLCLWDIEHPAELAYGINLIRPDSVWVGGNHVAI